MNIGELESEVQKKYGDPPHQFWTEWNKDIGQRKESALHKTIILTGSSKSGKTTLVNAIANHILGVKWDTPYRFTISRKDETTLSTNVYSIHCEIGFRIPFSLTIVDTPGKMDIGAMQQFLLNSEMKLSSLNALYLVSKSDQMLRPDEVLFVNSLISV